MRNTIVMGLKERKQKVRNIILVADKQIKEVALEFPDIVPFYLSLTLQHWGSFCFYSSAIRCVDTMNSKATITISTWKQLIEC